MRLCESATDLSGRQGAPLRAVTMEEVRQHRSEHDAWAVFHGKVYNITPYLHYHPGGVSILMKAAGKDATSLFNKYHAWVNLEGMMSVSQRTRITVRSCPMDVRSLILDSLRAPPQKCLIGHLAATVEAIAEGDEEEDEEKEDGRATAATPAEVRRTLEDTSDVDEAAAAIRDTQL